MTQVFLRIDNIFLTRKYMDVWTAYFTVVRVERELKRQHKSEKKLEEHNVTLVDRFSYTERAKHFVIRLFLPIVAIIEMLLANPTFQTILATLGLGKNLFLSYGASLVIILAEIGVGTIRARARRHIEKNPSQLPWYKDARELKVVIFGLALVVMIFLIPILSLSEMYQQIGVYKAQVEGGFMSLAEYNELLKGLRMRYIVLFLLASITHGCAAFFSEQIYEAWAFPFFKAKMEETDLSAENIVKVLEYRIQLLAEAYLKFTEKYNRHQVRFGAYTGILKAEFPRDLFTKITGLTQSP